MTVFEDFFRTTPAVGDHVQATIDIVCELDFLHAPCGSRGEIVEVIERVPAEGSLVRVRFDCETPGSGGVWCPLTDLAPLGPDQ